MKYLILMAAMLFTGCATDGTAQPATPVSLESELCLQGEKMAEEMRQVLSVQLPPGSDIKTEVFECRPHNETRGHVFVRVSAMGSEMDTVTVFERRYGEWKAVAGGPVVLFDKKKNQFFLNIQMDPLSREGSPRNYDL
jgi:hypothetical protein